MAEFSSRDSNGIPLPLDAAQLRARLSGARGADYWRSLEELAHTPQLRAVVEEEMGREFPAQFWEGPELKRRDFLKFLGAALALAGLSGCAHQPEEEILPYVNQPPELTLGKPLHFATATTLNGYATGILVQSHEGRPTKIEGNPEHPASLGATDAIAQAQILGLYDPDRSRSILQNGEISDWDAFVSFAAQLRQAHQNDGGAGLQVLAGDISSPTLVAQLQKFLAEFPRAKLRSYEPISRDNAREGALQAFARVVEPIYDFTRADIVLSLDADFLANYPGSVLYARDFMAARRVRSGQDSMNRLYVVESSPTITGATADHKLALAPSQIESFAREIAAQLGLNVAPPLASSGVPAAWRDALIADLSQHRGRVLVIAGREQPPSVHAIAHQMNANLSAPVSYIAPVAANTVSHLQSLRELSAEMKAGQVQTLLIIGGNPVYDAPVDFDFAHHLKQVPNSIHLGLYEDETAAACAWHIPQAHELEAWGDARAFEGTTTIQQPLIAPLYGGKSPLQVLAALLGQPNRSDYDIVREYWSAQRPNDFEVFWRAALHDGVVQNSAAPSVSVALKPDFAVSAPSQVLAAPLEIIFRPDPHIWDGRFANNGWLQELPKPISTLTWDNAALLSPATAQRLKLENGNMVILKSQKRSVRAPVFIVPGQADNAVTVYLGYGRTRGGQILDKAGFDAYALRTSQAMNFAPVEIVRDDKADAWELATTQTHHSLHGRDLVVSATLQEFQKNSEVAHKDDTDLDKKRPDLYADFPYNGYKWGMAIDLNACIGCNACTIACQAENNIPTVGKEEVARGREMHWIRVDSYFEGEENNPRIVFQPVPCMHCEKAPCEPVCPVGATQHSSEGLNEMVYNRCVGTRYCSNNCPYKVRRFNFLSYTNYEDKPTLKMLQNPDVTVRNRGVMEKCSYCVQRIQNAKIESEKQNRTLRDGEIVTACAQVCPTQAIVFGDLNDQNSRVAQLRSAPLSFGVLLELNTKPRTSYLARLHNPNLELET